jgi:TetR/AcrR family transcriptional repressor of uid operon
MGASQPARPESKRLGRPPAANSTETRRRILEVARDVFATQGYGITTNKDVATKAGITTGALYHYFDSKTAMYLAVYEEVQQQVHDVLMAAMAGQATFVGKFEAMLETAYATNAEQPGLAAFLGTARIDLARYDELRSVEGRPGEGTRFLNELVDHGVLTGEIPPDRRERVAALLRTIFVGLTVGLSGDLRDQRHAIDAIEALVEGRLLEPPHSR